MRQVFLHLSPYSKDEHYDHCTKTTFIFYSRFNKFEKKIRTEYSNFVIKIVRNQYKHLSSTFFHSDFIIIYHSSIKTKIKIQQVRQYQKRNI